MKRYLLLLAMVVLLLMGCSATRSTKTAVSPSTAGQATANRPSTTGKPETFLIFSAAVQQGQSLEQQLVAGVRADLAQRLGVSETAVSHLSTKKVQVPTTNPCGSASASETTLGFTPSKEIQLASNGQTHRYLANGRSATYCTP